LKNRDLNSIDIGISRTKKEYKLCKIFALLKPAKVTLFTIIFVQFGKQHSRYKAIISYIVSSQECCDVYSTPP